MITIRQWASRNNIFWDRAMRLVTEGRIPTTTIDGVIYIDENVPAPKSFYKLKAPLRVEDVISEMIIRTQLSKKTIRNVVTVILRAWSAQLLTMRAPFQVGHFAKFRVTDCFRISIKACSTLKVQYASGRSAKPRLFEPHEIEEG